MAIDDDLELQGGLVPQRKASTIAWLATMSALTVLAAGEGSWVGFNLVGTVKDGLRGAGRPGPAVAAPPYMGASAVRELAPIITNLMQPKDMWVRLQAAIIFDGQTNPNPEADAAMIAEDTLAFLRTLSIDQIAGPSGLQHLREDLNERAAIRSQGRVRELIIQTLVVQ